MMNDRMERCAASGSTVCSDLEKILSPLFTAPLSQSLPDVGGGAPAHFLHPVPSQRRSVTISLENITTRRRQREGSVLLAAKRCRSPPA